MNVQTARRFQELLSGQVEPAPYDYAVLFSNDGFFARRRSKARFKLLQGIDAKLRRVLRPEERVYFLTPGTTVSLAEQFFVGWIAYYLNMRALVFTTERVLLLEIDNRKRAGKLVSQIPYAAIATVKSTWTGHCRVSLINKETYNFQNVPKADRKFLAEFLREIVQGTHAPFQRVPGLEHLCPHCFALVPGHPTACPACRGSFKSPDRAALLSLAFPGVGDWYLGHRGVAIVELLGACFMWWLFVLAPLVAPGTPGAEPLNAAYWATVAIVLLVAHGVDALVTRHFALKGHHPHGAAPGASRASA